MASIPVEFLFGIYLGLLTGIIPAFVSGALGFAFKYLTGVTLPGLGVVVLAVAIAGINGGLMGLIDPAVASSPRIVVAIVVVMMLSLYAHSQGDKLGAAIPRRFSFRQLRVRTLSAEALDRFGDVTVTVTGTVDDLEGYPPLPAPLRTQIEAGSWSFPGDLPLSAVEQRFAERLKTEFDLADVSVSVDANGHASVAAAPPTGRLSRSIPTGKRAVSIDALLPTGLARGDHVVATTPNATVAGTVVSAHSTGDEPPPPAPADAASGDDVLPDGGAETGEAVTSRATAPTTEGGEGRVALAVSRSDATTLVGADRARIWVTSRGTHREFELVSLLRRAGKRFRRVTVDADSDLVGRTIAEAQIRDAYGIGVMAVRAADGADQERTRRGRRRRADVADRAWVFAPSADVRLDAGDELFVVGNRDALASFQAVIG